MSDKDPYQILGVSPDADEAVIEAAHRALAKKHHPDQNGDAEKFKEIQSAYEAIQNGSAQQSTGTKQSSDHSRKAAQRDQDFEPETYDIQTTPDIIVERLVQNAIGNLVTKNRLTKKEPGLSHPQTLTEAPLLNYLFKEEQPHFTFRANKLNFPEVGVFTPENGGYLVVTDVRVLVIVGFEDEDGVVQIPYHTIRSVNGRRTIGANHKMSIGTTGGEYRFKIQHIPINESGIRDRDDLDLEVRGAEEFIHELAYQAMS